MDEGSFIAKVNKFVVELEAHEMGVSVLAAWTFLVSHSVASSHFLCTYHYLFSRSHTYPVKLTHHLPRNMATLLEPKSAL